MDNAKGILTEATNLIERMNSDLNDTKRKILLKSIIKRTKGNKSAVGSLVEEWLRNAEKMLEI